MECTEGWGPVVKGANKAIRGLELSVIPLKLRGGARGLEIELITNGQGFNKSYVCNEALHKTPKG